MIRSLLYCFLFLLPLIVQAQDVPNAPNPPRLVNDLAKLMQAGDAQQLENKLLAYEQRTSNEIAIVTIPSIGDYDVQEYAQALGRKWNIGKAKKRNGVLLLIAVKERKINISPGDGLQGAITDAICSRIIRNTIQPAFRDQAFYSGLDSASAQLMRAAEGEFAADPREEDNGLPGAEIFIIILFIALIAFFAFKSPGPYTYVSGRGWTQGRRGPWDDGPGMPWGGGGFGGFGGGSSGGGGGFGGFGGGGGGFDGGGASGSW
jgi:uncharacterized protein